MSKFNRQEVGSILKSKDTSKPDYVKIKNDILLKAGDILNLESKASRLAGVDKAVESGKLTEDKAEEIREKINNMPDYVRFNIIKVTKEE